MYLHHHQGILLRIAQPLANLDHSPLDDIGGGPLHRGVNRRALGGLTAVVLARLDIWHVQTAPKHRLDVPLLGGPLANVIHKTGHPRVADEIPFDVKLRLSALDAQLACQPPGTHAIDKAKVDRFGTAALVARHRIERYAKHLGRRCRMDIAVVRKGV